MPCTYPHTLKQDRPIGLAFSPSKYYLILHNCVFVRKVISARFFFVVSKIFCLKARHACDDSVTD